LAQPAAERAWTAAARLETVIVTADMDEAARNAWCREHGVYPQQLQQWGDNATQALAAPEEARASPQQTQQDRRRIKDLERELRRKDKALAEAAAIATTPTSRASGQAHGAGRGHPLDARQARAAWRQRLHAQGDDGAGDAA
jgi:hypothetical protein